MAALDFPAAPSVGQTFPGPGASWQWDGTKWVGNGVSSGATVTWPLWAPDGTAAAPSYSFANAHGMGLYRTAAGGLGFAAAGVSKIALTAKGNLMLGMPEPADMSGLDGTMGTTLRAWIVTTGNVATHAYYDSTAGSPTWRRYDATNAPAVMYSYGGGYVFSSAAVGAAGSAITMNNLLTIDSAGTGIFSGTVQANGTVRSNGNRILSYGANNPSVAMYNTATGCNGFWNDVNNLIWWGTCDANGVPISGKGTFDTAGNIWAAGSVSAAGNVSATGNLTGAWIHSTGGIQADGSSIAYGSIISYTGRIISQAGQANPGFCNHWPGVFANGMICDGNGHLLLGQMDGNGNWVATWGNFDTAGNFWSTAATTATYLHSTGSADIDGRMTAHGGVMSSNGCFWIGDNTAYRLERESWSGSWVFYDNNTWNLQVNSNGDAQTRMTHYAQDHFCRNALRAGNDWNFYLGGGGAGRLLQYAANWYLQWDINNGQLSWMGGGGGWLMSQRTPDWLCWNQTGPVGGIGGYQNYSDMRGKTDIEPTTVGLTEIMKMKPARFTRTIKPEQSTGRFFPDGRPMPDFIPRSEIGFIAQELQEALPEAVVEVADFVDGEPRLMMTLDPIVAALVNAVQTLAAKVAVLEARP